MVFYAIGEEMMPSERNPFNRIKLEGEKTTRAFLLDEELNRMDMLKLKIRSMIDHHRNLYVFSAYSGGIRISYYCVGEILMASTCFLRLKDKAYVSKCLKIFTNTFLLPKPGKRGVGFPQCLTQIFNLRIDAGETDELKIFNAIPSATTFTNKSLGRLTKLAEIDKKISFHSAMHSWVVRALQKEMRIEYVSKLMGHASVRQTEVYAKILNLELDKAMSVFDKKEHKIRA